MHRREIIMMIVVTLFLESHILCLTSWPPSCLLSEGEVAEGHVPGQPESPAHPEVAKCTYIFHKRKCAAACVSGTEIIQCVSGLPRVRWRNTVKDSQSCGAVMKTSQLSCPLSIAFSQADCTRLRIAVWRGFNTNCSPSVFPSGFQ